MHNKNICLLKSVCMLSTVIVIIIINIQHLDLRESAMVVITLFHTFHSYAYGKQNMWTKQTMVYVIICRK